MTSKISNSVFVYNFLFATWRHGVHVPSRVSDLFEIVSDLDKRKVCVTGGHDEEKMTLKPAMVYDVATDEWVTLPDMS